MSRWVAFSLVFSNLALAAGDGGVLPPDELQVRATPASAHLGEPFVVELVVTHNPAQRYELVTPSELGDFEFLGSERHRVDGKTSSTTTFQVKLSAFTLGKQKTPSLALELTDPNGVVQLPVGNTDVEILSSLPADAATKGENLYDVRPPEDVPVRTWRLLYALAAIAGAGLLGWLLYRLFRDWKTRRVLAIEPPKPLHVRTLAALDALAKENLPGQGRAREYYFRVSEIIRAYLGELYLFEALECTTPELLEQIRSRYTPGLTFEELTAFASESDFVRYAKATATPDECKKVLEWAYRVVHATTAAAAAMQSPTTPAAAPHGPERAP